MNKIKTTQPISFPEIVENNGSDARDHCAIERNFLSYLRLSIYMSLVSLSVAMTFRLNASYSSSGGVAVRERLEQKLALPLGLMFSIVAALCLGCGLHNYVSTYGVSPLSFV